MYNNRSHPLLEQVPLTVSPFVSLPTATTLSYNYKTMPSTLPPSTTGIQASSVGNDDGSASSLGAVNKPQYVVSPSGHAAHPDDIVASCRALQAHLGRLQEEADRDLQGLEERIRERELAEKRRVAPGWLDSEARLLQPEKGAASGGGGAHEAAFRGMAGVTGQLAEMGIGGPSEMATDQGAEMDRVFGGGRGSA